MKFQKIGNAASVAAANAGNYFFSPGTVRGFRDSPSNWDVYRAADGRMFMRNARHRPIRHHGFVVFSMRGQWREVFKGGADIGSPIEAAQGMTAREFFNQYLGG